MMLLVMMLFKQGFKTKIVYNVLINSAKGCILHNNCHLLKPIQVCTIKFLTVCTFGTTFKGFSGTEIPTKSQQFEMDFLMACPYSPSFWRVGIKLDTKAIASQIVQYNCIENDNLV